MCAPSLVSLSLGNRGRIQAAEQQSDALTEPWAGGWMCQRYREWFEDAGDRRWREAFPGRGAGAFAGAGAMPACFVLKAFQILKGQLGMSGCRVEM